MRKIEVLPLLGLFVLTPSLAFASPPEGDAEGGGSMSLSASTDEGVDGDADADADVDADAGSDAGSDSAAGGSKWDKRTDQKWIKRWAPEKNMLELGIYGGVFLLAEQHELFRPDRDLPDQGYKPLRALNPEIGARIGYYPIKFFGIEAEGGVIPSALRDGGDSATLYTVRGHVVGQLGLWSVTPFVLLGAGGLGVSSDAGVLGNDFDPALHFGGGVKVYINRWVMLRLDIRDVVSHQQGVDDTFISHNLEALLGLSVTLGRANKESGPSDRDGDGFYDHEDSCPDDPGVAPDGCPLGDRDGDGILDDADTCPDDPETVNDFQDDDGCPESDRDGDGFWDDPDQDSCPDEAGVAPDGCPIPDTDGDGILDPDDACPQEPETENGFEDADGCPDEVPEALKKFTGAIKGITFETNKAEIRTSSRRTLDKAVKVLKEFPDIRIEISGHTDNKGSVAHNKDLSQRRADSVKQYFIDKGIDASRLETIGHGPDKPVDTNDTKDGRANNRRIEFRIIGGNEGVSAEATSGG